MKTKKKAKPEVKKKAAPAGAAEKKSASGGKFRINFSFKRDVNPLLMKETGRTVEKTLYRFVSIIAIVTLGISFFAGMNATAPDMLQTAQKYYEQTNLMDISVQSTVGLTDDDVAAIGAVEGVEAAVGVKTVDGFLKLGDERLSDIDGSEYTVRAISLNVTDAYNYQTNSENKPSYMNRVTLLEGTWPTATNECLVDASNLSTPDGFEIGETISLESDGNDLANKLNTTEYRIVGIIRSPLYVSYERGYTTVGSGKLGAFIYIPQECFNLDYYTQVCVKLSGSSRFKAYTKEYDSFVEGYREKIESISQARLAPRVQTIYNEYTTKVADGRSEYEKKRSEVELEVQAAKEKVEQIKYYAVYGDELVKKLKEEYNSAATGADTQLSMAKLEQTTQYQQWEEASKQYDEISASIEQYADAETQYNNAYTTWNIANNTVQTSLTTVQTLENAVKAGRSAIDQLDKNQKFSAEDVIDNLKASGFDSEEIQNLIADIRNFTAVGTAEEIAAYMEPELQSLELKLTASRTALASAQKLLQQREESLKKAEELVNKLNALKAQLKTAKTTLDNAEAALNEAKNQIQTGEQETLTKLLEKKNDITNLEVQVSIAKEKVDGIDAEYDAKVTEIYEELDKAKYTLEESEALLASLDTAKWYVNPRQDSVMGYEEYEQTSNRTNALSKVFPWIFFLVAAMVSLNTMARMVEEDRTQIGTLKALGFDNTQIMMKYIVYALSASLLGSVLGTVLGFWLFPTAITRAYSILYDLPPVILKYRVGYALIGTLLAVGLTVAASYFAVRRSLETAPSDLMRPEAPKAGSRIFLEKFDKIWSRLSFSAKITCRNVFRNKKRFIMAIAGVAGCTALLVAGLGLSDSIGSVLANQFESSDSICKYDIQIVLKNEQDMSDGSSEVLNTIKSRQEISNAMLTSMKVMRATSAKAGSDMEINLVIPQEPAAISDYIKLQPKSGRGYYTLGEKGCIVTDKLAKKLKISVGDQIIVEREKGDVAITVTGIVRNYTFHYVYISPTAYETLFGEKATYNYVTAILADGVTNEQRANLSEELMRKNGINAVAFTSQTIENLQYIMKSLNYVVIIIVAAAALLAFIVLYNLSNININERYKEIATLKVLGFNKNEVSAYISHENWILTAIGTLLGLILGIPLHRLVISIAEVDIVHFGRAISPLSFLYALLLSFLFTGVVNLVMRRHLRKIDMVESLKSVE
ncbi:MAG: ABC transporter permease [Oscillospiraceae bacterium]|nr:ABC transporter permease [Oscillospiraceae bacterium]